MNLRCIIAVTSTRGIHNPNLNTLNIIATWVICASVQKHNFGLKNIMHKLFYHKSRLIIQDSMSNQNYELRNYNRI